MVRVCKEPSWNLRSDVPVPISPLHWTCYFMQWPVPSPRPVRASPTIATSRNLMLCRGGGGSGAVTPIAPYVFLPLLHCALSCMLAFPTLSFLPKTLKAVYLGNYCPKSNLTALLQAWEGAWSKISRLKTRKWRVPRKIPYATWLHDHEVTYNYYCID